MSQISTLLQTLGAITQLSDKITTILIAIIAFFLLDKQFQFSENYRQNELHGRLKELLNVSYSGNDVSKRAPSGVQLSVLENQLRRLDSAATANVSKSTKRIVTGHAAPVKSDTATKTPQENHECLECLRISHCVLTVLTSGFWFFLYLFASFFYLFVRKIIAVKRGETTMSWPSMGIAAIAIIALLGPFILLAMGFAASLPIFYSPIFNYVLNIAISGFLLQAAAKVFGTFFVEETVAAPTGTDTSETPTSNEGAPVAGNFWDRLKWLFGISNKK